MKVLRAINIQQRSWVIILLALALFVRAVIPTGYMVAPTSLKLTVQVCAEMLTEQTKIEIEVPLTKGGRSDQSDHGQKSSPCAFSALSMASTAGDDSPLLILALAMMLAATAAIGAPLLRQQIAHLRPPLRGPPSIA
ncbi:MAG: hypothetical protein WBO17_10620 [Sphingorhabdus sp.]